MSTSIGVQRGRSELASAKLKKTTVGQKPLKDVLARTVELAKTIVTIPIEASITLIDDNHASTPAFTGQTAIDLDERQYQLGNGPSLAAAEAGQLIWIPDMTAERRWPEFTASAQNTGVHSSLSVPLPAQRHVIGALNFYSAEPHAFSNDVVALAEKFGGYAAVAIAHTTLYMSTKQRAEQMTEAMQSRAVIEQAKGILIGQRRCHPDEAFNILVTSSQNSNRKLHDVAKALLDDTLAP